MSMFAVYDGAGNIKVEGWSQIPKSFTGIVSFCERKIWMRNGEIHRENGPAVEWPDGVVQWWLNDVKYYSQSQWQEALDKQKEKGNKPKA